MANKTTLPNTPVNKTGLPYTPEYLAFYHDVIDALSREDVEDLRILHRRDARWFDDTIEDIENDMNCTFKRIWED